MAGLLLCGPVFASLPEKWPIKKSLYGSGDDHIKGDVFRVVVQFSNERDIPLRNLTAKLFYPKTVIPYPEKIYQKKISKFPWPNHFVDEDDRIITFHYNFDIIEAPVEFYSYFVAEKYGISDFDYSIEWLGPDSIYYGVNSKCQEIILPDSIEYDNHNVTNIIYETKIPESKNKETTKNTKYMAFVILLVFLIGALGGILLSSILVRKKYKIDELIKHFEEENSKLRSEISNEMKKMEKK